MKIVTIKGLWFHWWTKFHIDISSRLWVIGVWNIENRTHTRTHTHTCRRQLKITFLDVLDYSEYSDTNISNFFFHENIASLMRKKNFKFPRLVLLDIVLLVHCVTREMIFRESHAILFLTSPMISVFFVPLGQFRNYVFRNCRAEGKHWFAIWFVALIYTYCERN